MQKSPDAFRTITEVATWLDTPAHVLRFWESRFPEIAPVKRAGGRRYYRPEDMQLLGGIKHLLHTEGHTIKSVQERLQKDGNAAVARYSQPLDQLPGEEASTAAPATPEQPVRPISQPGLFDAPVEAVADAPAPVASPAPAPPASTTPAPVVAEPPVPQPTMAAEDDIDIDAPAFQMQEDDSPSPTDNAFDDELPPIGFFFDDSDDAAPAEVQSGTFADAAPMEPDPEPEREPDTAEDPPQPEPEPSTDPADPLPALVLDDSPPLPGVTHGLRALFPGALSPAQRAGFRDCANRLSALAIAAE